MRAIVNVPLMAQRAVLISDNAHACDAFVDFCAPRGLTPRIFHEAPIRHVYPGAGLGITSRS